MGMVTWDSMNPEILGLIFAKISRRSDEIVRAVSLVCKGWLNVVEGPYCWSKIDLYWWCCRYGSNKVRNYMDYYFVDFGIINLVSRSKSSLRSISTFRLGAVGFAYILNCGRFLTTLKMPGSKIITDDMVAKHAGSLVNLKELDISLCTAITHEGLSSFGKSSKSLTHLRRNLINWEGVDESEAYAIANTMRGLCHLELHDGLFTDCGLNMILSNCKSLTHLHIEGCANVSRYLEERCERLLVPMTYYFDFTPSEDEFTESTRCGSADVNDNSDDDDGDDEDVIDNSDADADDDEDSNDSSDDNDDDDDSY